MNVFRVIAARVAGIFSKNRLEQELEDELQFHFEKEVDLHVSRGLSIEDARAEARKRFGGADRAKELYRDTRGFPTIENFFRDLHYALRMLRNNPGFAMVAILSLALGIGINATVFTIVNAALLRSLPVADPDRLARISPSISGRPQEFSYPVFREIAERQQSFSDVAASGGLNLRHVIFEGRELQQMERLSGSYVSSNYFRMLGIQADVGRLFSSTNAQRLDESAVVVLRHGFWESAFGKDLAVVGRKLMINGMPLTIIGITPQNFTGDEIGRVQDLWVPIELQPRLDSRNLLEARTAAFFRTLGRLKGGMSKSQAVADVTAIYQQILAGENEAGTGTRLNQPNPASGRVEVLVGMDGFNPTRQRNQKPLMILMTVVAVVLLIACCNVANLLLARNAARKHEISTRLALGSSRARIMQQLLTESLLVALLGGMAGTALAQVGTRTFTTATADILFYLTLDLQLDARVLAFTAAVSLLTTVLFGTLPALYAARMHPGEVRNPVARFRQRTSRLLIAAQVALSLSLLLDAGLLIRSLWNLHSAELGFDRLHVSTFELAREPGLAATEFADLEREITERIRSLSQVQGVAFSSYGLFARSGLTAPARVLSGVAERQLNVGYISPEFFATFGMSIVLGRGLLPEDSRTAITPAILSEAAARHFFGDRNPMGEFVYLPGLDQRNRYIPFSEGLTEARRYEIVGVVRDAFTRGPREAPAYRLYLPIGPERFAETLYVRFASDAEQAIPAVLQVMRDYASKVSVGDATTLEWQLSQNYALETLGSRLLTFFGLLALVLAAVGLYGVMSYSVNRRTPEIGVRIALGAAPRGILIMVLRENAILVLIGIGLGIPLALVAARVLQTLLFGVTPYDPLTILTVISLLFLTGVIAGFVPARRASSVDAMVALRRE